MENNTKARVIAFYLPQFHPIPENDVWWGIGFTEWTNVGKAKPLFRGHYQPRVPADLGYYDLRLPEIREQQAEMAKHAGIEGFAYWHYWFAGKQLLERPFNEVLQSGSPNFPFCLAWANETWSGIWHGDPSRILIDQTYPGKEDYESHFYANLNAFLDERYIKINGKPIFYIYKPFNIPDSEVFLNCWRELSIKNGLKGMYFIGQSFDEDQAKQILALGYDAVNTNWVRDALFYASPYNVVWNKISRTLLGGKFNLAIWNFKKLTRKLSNNLDSINNYYPTILSGWDNSPRSGLRGRIFTNFTPDVFDDHVKDVLSKVEMKDYDSNVVFLKSWNEWAEGNYMEPDLRYGHKFLDVFRKNVLK